MILGFNKRFVEPIQTGMKIHSLREDKNNRWKSGRAIQMAVGVRTKNYKCFHETLCTGTQKINMIFYFIPEIWIDGRQLKTKEIETLAINDGFYLLSEFVEWFTKDKYLRDNNGKMIELKIIHWTDFRY